MNEPSLADGKSEKPKRRNRKRLSTLEYEQSLEAAPELEGGDDVDVSGLRVPLMHGMKVANARMRVNIIPGGPYNTRHAFWNALFVYESINNERKTAGVTELNDYQVSQRMKKSNVEINEELLSDGYRKFRISKSAGLMQQTIADIAPGLRLAIMEFMGSLKNMKRCKKCHRVGPEDSKKLQAGLEFVVDTMSKFGLPKIDTSFAEQQDEENTGALIKEAQAIIADARTWPNIAPQRVISALIEATPAAVGRPDQEALAVNENPEPLEGDAPSGPSQAVHSVPVLPTDALQPKEIHSGDNEQSSGEDIGDSGRHDDVRQGESSGGEDPETRNHLDIGGEERQDSAGPLSEVSGDVGGGGLSMGVQGELEDRLYQER